MLLTNLWKEKVLTNGVNGVVKYIVYDQNIRPPELPAFVLVKFDQYTGPTFLPNEEKLIPIAPITRNWFQSNTQHTRTMIHLTPSYAITIHKSQGQTLDKIVLDIGDKEFASGFTYTAISRAKKLEHVAFETFPSYLIIRNIFHSVRFKNRVKEEERLKKLEL